MRYPSVLTDEEWEHIEPLTPPAKSGGGKRRTDMRGVMDGVMYILSAGYQWRYIPKDFPPRSTLHDYFTWWNCNGTLNHIHHVLYVECREKVEQEASPAALNIRLIESPLQKYGARFAQRRTLARGAGLQYERSEKCRSVFPVKV